MTRSIVPQIAPPAEHVHSPGLALLAWHPHEPWLAVASKTLSQITLWREDGTLLHARPCPRVRGVFFDPAGQLAWAAGARFHGGSPFCEKAEWSVDLPGSAASVGPGSWVFARRNDTLVRFDVAHGGTSAFADVEAAVVQSNAHGVMAVGHERVWLLDIDGSEMLSFDFDPSRTQDIRLHPTEPLIVSVVGDWQGKEVVVRGPQGFEARFPNAPDFYHGAYGFAGDGNHLFIAGQKKPSGEHVRLIWNVRTGTTLHESEGTVASGAVALGPDGRMASFGKDHVELAVLRPGEFPVPTHALKTPFQCATGLGSAPGQLAIAWNKSVGVFDAGGLARHRKSGAPTMTSAVAFVPGRDEVLVHSSSDRPGAGTFVLSWDSKKKKTPVRGPTLPDGKGVSISANTRTFNMPDGGVERSEFALQAPPATPLDAYREEDKTLLAVGRPNRRNAVCLVASPGGRFHCIGYQNGALPELFAADGTKLATLEAGPEASVLAFSPSGNRLITASASCGVLKLWSVPDGIELGEQLDFGGSSSGSTFEQSAVFIGEERVAYISCGGIPRVWNTRSGARLALVADSAKRWAAFDDRGRCAGTKAGLKQLRVVAYDGDIRSTTPAAPSTKNLLNEFFTDASTA